MKNYTLAAYKEYLISLKKKRLEFYTFQDFFKIKDDVDKFIIIRHDVDRKPLNALKMAKLEKSLNIRSTYYFRHKKYIFSPEIIKEIYNMGHEIGYHYENLSDTDGDFDLAMRDFTEKLKKFRKIVPVRTIAMHGRPLKRFDNRDLWKDSGNHELLIGKLNILGEVYIDIDYSNIAYINDTGRNWLSNHANIRDKVKSDINTDFEDETELKLFIEDDNNQKIVFQIHPERWTDNELEWFVQYLKDSVINLIKKIIIK